MVEDASVVSQPATPPPHETERRAKQQVHAPRFRIGGIPRTTQIAGVGSLRARALDPRPAGLRGLEHLALLSLPGRLQRHIMLPSAYHRIALERLEWNFRTIHPKRGE